MNQEHPMSAIGPYYEEYDKHTSKTKLDFDEFIDFYNRKAEESYKCTISQEDEAKDITKCSTIADCYDRGTRQYENSKCPGRESCAKVVAENWRAPGTSKAYSLCLLSQYCTRDPTQQVFGASKRTIYSIKCNTIKVPPKTE